MLKAAKIPKPQWVG